MTETELIDSFIKGERKAFETVYRRYSSRMLGVAMRYTFDKPTAEDILQEAFIKIYHSLSSFKNSGSLEGWIRRIVVRTAINFFRASKIYEPDTEMVEDYTEENIEIDNNYNAEELLQLIGSLPSGYRIVFNMFVIEGYSHKEIAENLGISENTSKSQLAKAKSTLKNILEKKKFNSDEYAQR